MGGTEPIKIEQPFKGDDKVYYVNGGRCSGKVDKIINELVDCINELQQENKKYKEVIKKVKKLIIDNIEETTYEYISSNKIKALLELRMDNDGVNKLLDIIKEVK